MKCNDFDSVISNVIKTFIFRSPLFLNNLYNIFIMHLMSWTNPLRIKFCACSLQNKWKANYVHVLVFWGNFDVILIKYLITKQFITQTRAYFNNSGMLLWIAWQTCFTVTPFLRTIASSKSGAQPGFLVMTRIKSRWSHMHSTK